MIPIPFFAPQEGSYYNARIHRLPGHKRTFMQAPVKVGIVGLGRWARVLTRAAAQSEKLKIVAAHSRTEDKRNAFRVAPENAAANAEGKRFAAQRLAAGAGMLRDLWVAAMQPAVSEARLVVSIPRISPASAISWPLRSTTKMPLALASRTSRWTTPRIRR